MSVHFAYVPLCYHYHSMIIIVIISGGSSSSSSSSSTQRSARWAVDEMHVFQKKVFSPRPEASVQVYFNAKTHL